jgi:hypothetical protein
MSADTNDPLFCLAQLGMQSYEGEQSLAVNLQ